MEYGFGVWKHINQSGLIKLDIEVVIRRYDITERGTARYNIPNILDEERNSIG